MRSIHRRAAVGGSVLLCALLATGCSGAVREDRSIRFAPGGAAAFQHGRQGVFLADPAGGPPRRIFRPGPEVVAVSPPRWAPAGKRLLFTTARRVRAGAGPGPQLPPEPVPAGAVYFQEPVTYACWLYDTVGRAQEPHKLFEADLEHVGYVAADLAVRWTPDGAGVLFLQAQDKQHALHRFDLKSGRSRRAFPRQAEAFLFDFTPDGSRLCCVLGEQKPSESAGVWIGRPGEADWWHVPGSEALPPGRLGSLLERLRAARPAWTSDGRRFAFLSHRPGLEPKSPGKHLLKVGAPATRDVRARLESAAPLREPRWSPDGRRLGCLRGGPRAELCLLDADAGPAAVIARSVRAFAGWDPAGERLAYVVAGELPHRTGERWALLLTPHEEARDAVCLAAADGGKVRRPVEGLHATFPGWAPDRPTLGVWLTFEPPYTFGPGPGLLRPIDPATLIDATSGALTWQPVGAREKTQLAHHHLRRRAYDAAWGIYAQVENDPAVRASPEFPLFVAHCLDKLGRAAQAKERLNRFLESEPRPAAITPLPVPQPEQPGPKPRPAEIRFARACLAAEVFLSLDEPGEAEAFLRRSLKDAAVGEARCLGAVALAQVLLLRDRKTDYLDLLAQTLLPPLPKVWRTLTPEQRGHFRDRVGLTILSAASPSFLSLVPAGPLRPLAVRLDALRQVDDDGIRLVADAALAAVGKKLGDEELRRFAEARLKSNPARAQHLWLGQDDIDKAIEGFRAARFDLGWWLAE
jgi:hypothetical protein